jgi:putative tricarboxylic transport membrane protein
MLSQEGEMILCEKFKDVIAGGFVSLLGLMMFIMSYGIKTISGETADPGSAFMPKIGAALLFIFGMGILIEGMQKYRSGRIKADTSETVSEKRRKLRAVLLTLGLIGVYIFLLNIIGFIYATILYLFIQIVVLAPAGKRNAKNYLYFGVIAVVLSVSVYYLFYEVFSMMLPAGIIG